MHTFRSADTRRFRAPWSATLRWVTLLGCAVLLGTAVTIWIVLPPKDAVARGIGSLASVALVVGTALFTVRGYRLEARHVLVDRLLWSTWIPLEGLQSVEIAPEAMRRSIRLWGNGGLFAFTGWFRNRQLGTYRCFATDPARSVVLRFPNRRIVLTPDDPPRFAEVVGDRLG
jgi:hypothetical protein